MSNIIATDIQQQEIDSALVELFEIALPGGDILYFHPGVDDDLTNIQFKSVTAPAAGVDYVVNTYVPMPMIMDGLDLQADGASTRPALTIANIGTLLSSQLGTFKNDDLIGQRLIRRQTLKKYLKGESADTADTVASIEFRTQEYIIDRIASEDGISVTFEVALPFDLENIKLPRRVVVGKYCSWQYQGHKSQGRGGCTWNRDGSVVYKSSSTLYTHNGYFNIDDNPLVHHGVSWNAHGAPSNYVASTAYTTADYVQWPAYGGIFYNCIIAGTGNEPSATSSYWIEALIWADFIAAGKAYTKGMLVRYGSAADNKTIWKCQIAHTTSQYILPPSATSSYWIREEACGKTLNSCKRRFGYKPNTLTASNAKPDGSTNSAARLPFGSFPGTQKF